MISRRLLDLVGAGAFLALGAALFVASGPLETPGHQWMVDRGFWPKWIGALMMVLSTTMALQGWYRSAGQVEAMPGRSAWLLLASLAGFLLLLPLLGYIVSSMLWMVVLGRIAGERSLVKLLAFALGWIALGYIVFWKILFVPLPVGLVEEKLGLDYWIYR
ncbi:MAG: tripartite tricarboxylate transporter TctB family protein [Betaproteobacteria bacterium]